MNPPRMDSPEIHTTKTCRPRALNFDPYPGVVGNLFEFMRKPMIFAYKKEGKKIHKKQLL